MSEQGAGSRGSGVGEIEGSDTRLPVPDSREPNWPLLYAAVIGELAILIIVFYAFTKAFA